jgi:hypothetical protein
MLHWEFERMRREVAKRRCVIIFLHLCDVHRFSSGSTGGPADNTRSPTPPVPVTSVLIFFLEYCVVGRLLQAGGQRRW